MVRGRARVRVRGRVRGRGRGRGRGRAYLQRGTASPQRDAFDLDAYLQP